MKLTKILLTTLVTFTVAVNADGYKFKVCERAETSFWDTIQSVNSSADQSLAASLGDSGQISYYNMELAKIEKSITEVRKRCEGIASKEILSAYNQKRSEIEGIINAL